jgi:uncharacterized protein YjiS (DUF1127 family)
MAGSTRAIEKKRFGGGRWPSLAGLWSERAREHRHLARLPDEALAAIGISHCDLHREIRKPFWRA